MEKKEGGGNRLYLFWALVRMFGASYAPCIACIALLECVVRSVVYFLLLLLLLLLLRFPLKLYWEFLFVYVHIFGFAKKL